MVRFLVMQVVSGVFLFSALARAQPLPVPTPTWADYLRGTIEEYRPTEVRPQVVTRFAVDGNRLGPNCRGYRLECTGTQSQRGSWGFVCLPSSNRPPRPLSIWAVGTILAQVGVYADDSNLAEFRSKFRGVILNASNIGNPEYRNAEAIASANLRDLDEFCNPPASVPAVSRAVTDESVRPVRPPAFVGPARTAGPVNGAP